MLFVKVINRTNINQYLPKLLKQNYAVHM